MGNIIVIRDQEFVWCAFHEEHLAMPWRHGCGTTAAAALADLERLDWEHADCAEAEREDI